MLNWGVSSLYQCAERHLDTVWLSGPSDPPTRSPNPASSPPPGPAGSPPPAPENSPPPGVIGAICTDTTYAHHAPVHACICAHWLTDTQRQPPSAALLF